MINFLKKLFGKEEELEPINIDLKDLPQWLNQQSEIISNPVKYEIEAKKEELISIKEKLKTKLKNLEEAKLKNPNITPKEIHFMEGNRTAYMQKASQFFDSITIPDEINLMPDAKTEFESRLEDFTKATSRPYYILQQFFANEAREVALLVKDIEKIFKHLGEKHEDYSSYGTRQADDKIKELNSRLSYQKELFARKEETKKNQDAEKKELAVLDKKKKDLLRSEKYKHLEVMKKELATLQEEKKAKEDEIRHLFSTLEHALKKYSKIAYENDDVARKYLQDPVGAIVSDFSMSITKLLTALEKAIEKGEVELKDKKKEKTISLIKKMDESFFARFLSEYNKMHMREEQISNELKESEVEKHILDTNMRIRLHESNLKSVNDKAEQIDNEINKLDIDGLKKDLEHNLKAIASRDVIVQIGS